jgi:hypothetical protein
MAQFSKILLILCVLTGFQAASADWKKQTTNTFAWFKDISFLW